LLRLLQLALLTILFACITIITPSITSADLNANATIIVVAGDDGHSVSFDNNIFANNVVYWQSYSSIQWRYNLWDLEKYNVNDADSLFAGDLADSFNRWQTEADIDITFSPQGATADTTGPGDNINTVLFVNDDYYFWGGTSPATTYHTWDTNNKGKLLDVDIYFRNDPNNYEWSLNTSDEDNGVYYLPRIATHEIGHLIGLGHPESTIASSIMQVLKDSYSVSLNGDDKILGAYLTSGNIIDNVSLYEVTDYYINRNINIKNTKTLTLNKYSSDPTVNVTSGKSVTIEGTLELKKNTTFTKNGSTNWYGFIIDGGTIDNNDSGNYRKVTITNASSGITVDDCSPLIKKVEISDSTNGIEIIGTSAAPLIQWVTSTSNTYGINVNGTSADAVVDYCSVTSNSTYGVRIASGGYVCLSGPSLNGNNTIDEGSGTYAVYNGGAGTAFAENNYWGTSSPTSGLFYGSVDWNPYRTTAASGVGAGKIAVPVENNLTYPMEMELAGNYEEAISGYEKALRDEPDVKRRKFILTSILRVIDKHDRKYDDFRKVLTREMDSSDDEWYRACVDYLLTSILVREGMYDRAVVELLEKSAEYRSTTMEVEMLSRAAVISGVQLNDHKSALACAKRAEEINPGSYLVRMAYRAGGVDYDNTQFEDVFFGKNDGFNNFNPRHETASSNDEMPALSVSITPNPANPTTIITYSIAETSNVRLTIYSVSGQKVATLVDGSLSAGTHSVVFDGSHLASGVYFYRLESKGFAKSGKMLLIK